jgi:riboflavin kinase/FMN adenylyltransferase
MIPNNTTWMKGLVVRGDGRGRKLGFPTANLQLVSPCPLEGIYACWAGVSNGQLYKAVLHCGPRPTFPGASNSIPDQDMYGQTISFVSVQKIRDITKFNSNQDLSLAMEHDCETARRVLENAKLG